MSSAMLAYDKVKMLTRSWLTTSDRRKRRLRPPRDARLGAFEAEDDHEPNRGGATRKRSPGYRWRRLPAVVHSDQLLNSSYSL
jgi:hypothetical protein